MNSDPAFQLLARASGYLEAARIVVENGGNKAVLRAPVAHLIAHALEVLMKHVLVTSGHDLGSVRKKYGHSLGDLWKAQEMSEFRSIAFIAAKRAWDDARRTENFCDSFDDDPAEVLRDYIKVLGGLHSRETDFALRYVAAQNEKAPVPLFLLDTFQPVKDKLEHRYSCSERAKSFV